MDATGRVTRSLRRRLNSVDVDISNGATLTPEKQFLREDLLKTPTRKNLFLSEGNRPETPVTERTPVTRSGRHRSVEVNSSPALTGTPLRRTRRNSITSTDAQTENIGSAKKNLRKSLIPDIAEETEQINIDNDKFDDSNQKFKKVFVKIEKLKKHKKTKSVKEYEEVESELKSYNDNSKENFGKTCEDESSTSDKNTSSSTITEKNDLSDNECNRISIRNEEFSGKKINSSSDESEKYEGNRKNDNLQNEATSENKEPISMEVSDGFNMENSEIKIGDHASNVASKNDSLIKEKITEELGTEMFSESDDEVPATQIGQNKYNTSSTEKCLKRSFTESKGYYGKNMENIETNNRDNSSHLKNINVGNHLNINSPTNKNIKENSMSKSFIFKISYDCDEEPVDSDRCNESLSKIENNQVVDNNETDIKMKSVTFNDSDSHSEKDNSKFRKTPVASKSKNNVLNGSTSSEFNDSPTKINTLKNSTINNNDEVPQCSFENINISKSSTNKSPNKTLKKTSIASSTPLNTLINVNSKKKTYHLSENKTKNIEESSKLSKSWTQSVRGTSKEKIDKFCLSLQENMIVTKDSQIVKQTWQKSTEFTNDHCKSDEENSSEKDDINEFIDNEAVECSNENSLNDEERQYLEDNEIIEKGRSLGSEDTTQSSNDTSVDDDSFIDHEENLELLSTDSEEYLITSPCKDKLLRKKKIKNFITSDSSDEGEGGVSHLEKSLNKSNNKNSSGKTKKEKIHENCDEVNQNQSDKKNSLNKSSNKSETEIEIFEKLNSPHILENKTHENCDETNQNKSEKKHLNRSLIKSEKEIEVLEKSNSSHILKDKTHENCDESNQNQSEKKHCLNRSSNKSQTEMGVLEKSNSSHILNDSFAKNVNSQARKTPSKSPKSINDTKLNKLNESLNNNVGLILDVTKFADQSSSEDERENSKISDKGNKLNKSKNYSALGEFMIANDKENDFVNEKVTEIKHKENSETEFNEEREKSISLNVVKNSHKKKKYEEIKNSSQNLLSKNYKEVEEQLYNLDDQEIAGNNTDKENFNLDNIKKSPNRNVDLKNSKNIILHSSYTEELKNKNETSSPASVNISKNNESNFETEKKITKNLSDMEKLNDYCPQKQIKTPSSLKDNDINKTEDVNSTKNTNISHILKRCNDILNAANEAKLRDKVKRKNELKNSTQKNRNIEARKENEKEVFKDSNKSRVKNKKAVFKALQHAEAVLLNKVLAYDDNIKKQKTLPKEVLDAISKKEGITDVKTPKKSKTGFEKSFKTDQADENNEINIKKDKLNSLEKSKLISTTSGIFVEEPITPKKRKISKIELPIGTVYVEPITPTVLKQKSGFVESPITPLGFKVRNILSAGQKEIPELKLNTKAKRKIIDEPVNVLPKTVWSSSGEFVEETYKPIKNKDEMVSTEFYAVPLKTKKIKVGQFGDGIINEKVTQFKQKALSSTGNCRESSKQLLQRKERYKINYK